MKSKKKNSATGRMYFRFTIGAALILLLALGFASVFEFIIIKTGVISESKFNNSSWYWIPIFMVTSIAVGVLLAYFLGKVLFKPIRTLAQGMTKLAEGDFSTRIELGKYEGMKNLAESFNTLATELENTEIFRSDFINEFSHELKTPIVSISALIPLMKSDSLTPEKKNQYLAIMEEETQRLTQMTSNTLYLSKLEMQTILTNTNLYNVSEQIRSCFLLLERKWEKKELIPSLEFEEYNILANEDMLKQVWLNLLDNAIKFSEPSRELSVSIEKIDGKLVFSFENYGQEIPEEECEAIFNKFYQCDKSRSTDGNGIGLSIVKHIVTLHGGSVYAKCKDGKTTFTVALPCSK